MLILMDIAIYPKYRCVDKQIFISILFGVETISSAFLFHMKNISFGIDGVHGIRNAHSFPSRLACVIRSYYIPEPVLDCPQPQEYGISFKNPSISI